MASIKPRKLHLGLAILAVWLAALALVFFLFALAGCTAYNPSLYPGYDVLNPSAAVRANPLSISEDPITHEAVFTVTADFLMWVEDLKQEILKLRKGAK